MPSSLNQFTPDKQYADGFTLIEIVMVLVLLGILSAVAVPKYFDLQEEAIAKKCQHNRGVVQSSVITQYAAAQLDGTADSIDDDGWEDRIDEVMQDLGGTGCTNHSACEKLCEAGGKYDVTFTRTNGNLMVNVTCTYHDKGSNSNNSGSGAFLGQTEADFLEWLNEYYNTVLDFVFTKDKHGNPDTIVDSETASNSAVEAVLQSLRDYGFDLDNSILSISRKDNGYFDAKGNFIREIGDPTSNGDGTGNKENLHWRATLTISIASKTPGMKAGDTILGKSYTMTLDFNDKHSSLQGKEEANIRDGGYGELKPIGDADSDTYFELEESEKDSSKLVIRPKK